MANTKSARKATRKIARRTIVNKSRRSLLRNSVRKIEEAIASGDRTAALAAFKEAEPALMRAAEGFKTKDLGVVLVSLDSLKTGPAS